MFNHPNFGHDLIRKHVIVLGTMLNQIYISRTDANNDVVSVTRIPIAYGPKDKTINRMLTDTTLSRPFGTILPFISFELVRVTPRPDDQLPKLGRFAGVNTSTTSKDVAPWVHNPKPYSFEFDVHIMVKTVSDGWKIVEQVLPWFDPDWTVTVKLVDEPYIALDIKTLCDPVDLADNYAEGDYGDTRIISWTLHFRMDGYLFGPSIKSKIIKKVNVNFGDTEGSPSLVLSVTPGLTANGGPTSDSANTVPYSDISWDDDYGYIDTISDPTVTEENDT